MPGSHRAADGAFCSNCKVDWTVEVEYAGATLALSVLGAPGAKIWGDTAQFDTEILEDLLEPPPPNGYELFKASLADVEALRSAMDERAARSPVFLRMVFMQHFAALEAYLSDTLRGLTLEYDEILAKLVATVPELRNAKISLEEALDASSVRRRAVEYLASVSFHNFAVVDKLYQSTLGTRVIPEKKAQSDVLFLALNTRHDCVHRNGVSREGREHSDLADQVRRIEKLFDSIANRIESACSEWERQQRRPRLDDDLPF